MTNICEARAMRRLGSTTRTSDPSIGELGGAGLSDGRLLERFIQHQDESAFAEIVRRHGLMVLGVCQRVLDNRHDAEDCFQAAFMVLMRKATTIHPREMVGNWLYGVAYRTALEARKLAARRRNLEKKKQAMAKPEPSAELWSELRPVLDQELSRLPDKYRFVLIACDLEGKTRSEVAGLLDVPEGTIASRLARARALLAKRLHRHRLLVSPAMLARLLAERALAPSLPESLVDATANLATDPTGSLGASLLADAVVKAMLWSKLKIAAAAVCAAVLLGLGVTSLLPSASAERKHDLVKVPQKPRRITDCIVRKVDLVKREVQADDGGAELHLRVDPTAKVLIGGKEAKLSDLRADMIVNVEVARTADGGQQALRIEAVSQSLEGHVQSIEADCLTFQAEGQALVAEAITIDPEAKVTIKGIKGKLSDVTKGMHVTLQITAEADRGRIIAITSPPTRRP